MADWQDNWNEPNVQGIECSRVLEALIKLGEYDGGAGKIDVADWRKSSQHISSKLSLSNKASVFVVDCGSAALPYSFIEQLLNFVVGGIDYNTPLIESVLKNIPNGTFECIEAANLDSMNRYDMVISNSVFQYFDHNYARTVFSLMIVKANVSACELDIPDDISGRKSELFHRGALSPREYDHKYTGLPHTCYQRKWFNDIALENDLKSTWFNGGVLNHAKISLDLDA
jgi:trans-aconitate methyltransferase